MKFSSFLIFVALQCSTAVPIGKNSSSASTLKISKSVGEKSHPAHITLFPDDREEYVLLVSEEGHIIIINAKTYQEMTAYYEPTLKQNSVALANEEFYCIDKLKGTIRSSHLTNVITRPNDDIKLKQVASFPKEHFADRNVVAVTENRLYFTTYMGKLYKYDTVLELVEFCADLTPNVHYNSLIVMSSALYILGEEGVSNSFYYYNDKIYPWNTTDIQKLKNPALFLYDDIEVCAAGGSSASETIYPVYCYRRLYDNWTKKFSSSIEARQKPGIATTQYGTFIIGGIRVEEKATSPIKTIEVLNKDTGIWSYIPTPSSMLPNIYSAMSFYFGQI